MGRLTRDLEVRYAQGNEPIAVSVIHWQWTAEFAVGIETNTLRILSAS